MDEVAEALEQARDVVEGPRRKKSSIWQMDPHLIHESSSVQVRL